MPRSNFLFCCCCSTRAAAASSMKQDFALRRACQKEDCYLCGARQSITFIMGITTNIYNIYKYTYTLCSQREWGDSHRNTDELMVWKSINICYSTCCCCCRSGWHAQRTSTHAQRRSIAACSSAITISPHPREHIRYSTPSICNGNCGVYARASAVL